MLDSRGRHSQMQHFVSKHIVDTTFFHRYSSKLCVTMRTFMYFGICKERTAFVSVSRQVGMLAATSACGSSWNFLFTFMYVMTGLMSDSQVLMVPSLHGS